MSDIILPNHTGMTEKQKRAAVKEDELPPCVGTPLAECRSGPTDLLIKGYDDKMRCSRCNAVHTELVFKEAGESAPGATQPQFVPAAPRPQEETELRQHIRSKFGPRDGFTAPPQVKASPGEVMDMRGRRAGTPTGDEPVETPAERRERVLAKYRKKNR